MPSGWNSFDREPDNSAQRVDLERDDGFGQMAKLLHPFDVPRHGQASRWIALQNLALRIDAAVLHDQLERRAHFPVRLHTAAKEILLGELAAGKGLPELLGSRDDVGDEYATRFVRHCLPLRCFL